MAAFNRRSAPLALPTRVGLNAGRVMVGNVGGSGRFAYSVVGDCVNTAARIEGLNKQLGTRILADRHGDGRPARAAAAAARPLPAGRQAAAAAPAGGRRAPGANRTTRDGSSAFAEALARFEAERWAEAAERFESILAAHPADGPTRFYLDRCRRYQAGGPLPPDPGLIRLEHK